MTQTAWSEVKSHVVKSCLAEILARNMAAKKKSKTKKLWSWISD